MNKLTIAILLCNTIKNLDCMRKFKALFMLLIASILAVGVSAQGQVTVTGSVKNSKSKEVVSAVSVTIKGTSAGTFTDDKGEFKIVTSQKLPFTLVFSSVGFADKEVSVTTNNQVVNVDFEVKYAMGEEVVVAASRVAERIIESPVSIERLGQNAIKNAAVPNFYDAIANFKGVDLTTSSINFRTISTRGFNGSGNLRLNQLIDGMDNQAPALNFAVGSIIGPTELDIDNVELLQGASSALYGSGGMNGTLLMTTKSPFKYQGFSFQVKQGINHVDNAQRSGAPFYDWSFRWGKKISEKFAFRLSGQFTQAQDWQANDLTNLNRNNVFSSTKAGDRVSDPNYDGVNVYGDEVGASMQYLVRLGLTSVPAAAVTGLNSIASLGLSYPASLAIVLGTPALAPAASAFPSVFSLNRGYYNQNISRTGYNEKDLANYGSYNVRLAGGLYYKLNDKVEASIMGYWGIGSTVYTGIDRYSLKNFKMGQYKAELKAKNWFLRAYTTQENSGDSYAATITAVQMNRIWKSDATWFGQYLNAYTASMLGTGGNAAVSNAAGRAAADAGRLTPGSTGFNDAFNQVTTTSITKGGGLFADKSGLYHFEGQYNLSDKIKVADVLVGANYRIYHLNSQGTIFADSTGPINIKEYGGYLQVAKKFINDIVKLTGTVRYDKNENFDGRFTPRLSATIKVAKDNNIRLSYQTAYRFPSTQDQWINLNSPSATLIGALPNFNTAYNFSGNPVYTSESILAYRTKFAATGAIDPTVLVKANFTSVKPESVTSYEIGYRGIIAKKLLIDVYYYYSEYKDFLGKVAVGRGGDKNTVGTPLDLLSPSTTTNFSFVYNTTNPVKATGWGASAEYQLPSSFVLTANVSGDQLSDVQPGVVTFFNTPKIRYNVGLSNTKLFKTNWGFNVVYRWQDKVDWEGTFGSGQIPSYGVVDGQISYRFVKEKGLLKFGAMNLWNKYYRSAFGNPRVGGLYYVSYGFNL
jgi:outer membrane receptor protein involved in Fe transport